MWHFNELYETLMYLNQQAINSLILNYFSISAWLSVIEYNKQVPAFHQNLSKETRYKCNGIYDRINDT
jgi:hypothetical protein